jgi:hypothetical protein
MDPMRRLLCLAGMLVAPFAGAQHGRRRLDRSVSLKTNSCWLAIHTFE